MGRGRAANYDDQREMILARAAQLFARRGYVATSMNEVATACGLSKATLYHYYKDKYALLVSIAEGHVLELRTLVQETAAQPIDEPQRLREMILGIVGAYSNAQDAHRVLTEDVKFLEPADRERVLDIEREVVAGFAAAVASAYPQAGGADLGKPLTMLLFGMVNWMFTWMKPDGPLTHEAIAPIVADLFAGGVPAVERQLAPTSLVRGKLARETVRPTRHVHVVANALALTVRPQQARGDERREITRGGCLRRLRHLHVLVDVQAAEELAVAIVEQPLQHLALSRVQYDRRVLVPEPRLGQRRVDDAPRASTGRRELFDEEGDPPRDIARAGLGEPAGAGEDRRQRAGLQIETRGRGERAVADRATGQREGAGGLRGAAEIERAGRDLPGHRRAGRVTHGPSACPGLRQGAEVPVLTSGPQLREIEGTVRRPAEREGACAGGHDVAGDRRS
jgi:AcrR family transcriptional regulator